MVISCGRPEWASFLVFRARLRPAPAYRPEIPAAFLRERCPWHSCTRSSRERCSVCRFVWQDGGVRTASLERSGFDRDPSSGTIGECCRQDPIDLLRNAGDDDDVGRGLRFAQGTYERGCQALRLQSGSDTHGVFGGFLATIHFQGIVELS